MVSYNTAPNPVDLYSRMQVDKYDERDHIGVATGFQSFFGRPASGGRTLFSPDASVVEIDIIRGNERIAALIPRGIISRPLGSLQKDTAAEKFSSVTRRFPLAEEEGNISADQLEFRSAGENPYENRDRLTRMRSLADGHHKEHFRRMIRMFEVLSAQAILTGEMDAIIGTSDANLKYDFYRKATHSFGIGTAWSDVAADALGDIDDGCQLIREDGHVDPDICLMGQTSINGFLKNTDVKAKADNRRFEMIEISQSNPVPTHLNFLVEAGMTPRGRLRTPAGYNLWLFSYVDVYTDAGGSPVKYMPDTDVLIASSQARCDRYFGPSEVMPNIPQRDQMYQQLFGFSPDAPPMPPMVKNAGAVVNPAMFHCDAYMASNWKSVTIRTQAAPIFAPTMTDAFVTIDVS